MRAKDGNIKLLYSRQMMKENIMRTDDFDYYLPKELIAQHPAQKRDMSRLLVMDKSVPLLVLLHVIQGMRP